MASNTNKDYTQMHIKASDHPKAYAPHICKRLVFG